MPSLRDMLRYDPRQHMERLLRALETVLLGIPRLLYRRIVIDEQLRARRIDERRAGLLELRDALGKSIHAEHIHQGGDRRLGDADAATARARVLVVEAPSAVREAVTRYCDAYDVYRRKWSAADASDLELRHTTFEAAIAQVGEALRDE